MIKPRICASIVNDDLTAIKAVEPLVDLFEVRIDLIGGGWRQLAQQMKKPWIACNRRAEEGGGWRGIESKRVEAILEAVQLGASIADVELDTGNLREVVSLVKKKAKCLLSHHDLHRTPNLDKMKEVVRRQRAAGADICKVVTTANKSADNLPVLQLITAFPQAKVVAFAMGHLGYLSRVLCPLVGGDFTYASVAEGIEAAPGQVTVRDLGTIYGMLRDGG